MVKLRIRQILFGVAVCLIVHPLAFLILFFTYILFAEVFHIETNTVGLIGLLKFNFTIILPVFAAFMVVLGLLVFPFLERRGFLVPSILLLLGGVLAPISTFIIRQYLGDWTDTSVFDLIFFGGPVLAFFFAYAGYIYFLKSRK